MSAKVWPGADFVTPESERAYKAFLDTLSAEERQVACHLWEHWLEDYMMFDRMVEMAQRIVAVAPKMRAAGLIKDWPP